MRRQEKERTVQGNGGVGEIPQVFKELSSCYGQMKRYPLQGRAVLKTKQKREAQTRAWDQLLTSLEHKEGGGNA